MWNRTTSWVLSGRKRYKRSCSPWAMAGNWRSVLDSNQWYPYERYTFLAGKRLRPTRPTLHVLAETVRFELTELLHSTVFKTVAINRTLPRFHYHIEVHYTMCFNMAAPLGFEPRNVGIKIRCLRPTWRKGYKTLQIFKDQELKYMSVQHSWQACCFYATHKTKPPDF